MIIDICDELKQNFIDFAYEANSQRAFPDARDGLKPGQRACIWEMYTKGYSSNKPHVKSAKIDGGVAATWWPHGTTAIYETFARMSQPWINNIPEVDWHGSNGNIVIGSCPAADRYTEARLSKAIEDGMLVGIKKDNVPMILNFSEDEEWPEVLPAIFPRLLINGSQGIGVTVAQTWIPHNLKEVINIVNNYLSTGEIDYKKIAPDFPTGGVIVNKDELPIIYQTGKGKVIVRAKIEIEKNTIKITELPYQVYVEPLIDEIKKLIEDGELTGINAIYNKTDKKRLLIEIECSENIKTILNKLMSSTNLQKTFNPNQMALVGKTPKMLNLKDYLEIYINHNIECIKKEYAFDLEKASAKLSITEGLLKALEDIDNIITLIKKSESSIHAKEQLKIVYNFTDEQANAIVNMRLGKLAHLEAVELNKEKENLIKIIEECNTLLNSKEKQKDKFLERLNAFGNKYSNDRKTELIQLNKSSKEEKEIEFVEPEKCVVVMTKSGLIKRVPATAFKTQRKAGKGVKTQDDITAAVIRTNTVDSLMIFTNKGKMYRLLVNDIPVGTNVSVGQSIKTLVTMDSDEQPQIIYSIYRNTDAKYVLFVTKNGIAKKTSLDEYIKTKKKTGLAAINLKDGDKLASVSLVKDENIIILTAKGMGLICNSLEVSATSRNTTGSKGITLNPDDYVIAALPIRDQKDQLALFVESGMGKRIDLSEIKPQARGGKGLIYYKTTPTSGMVAAAALVSDEDKILVCGDTNSICVAASEITTASRISIGSQILKNNLIVSVSKV